MHMDVCIYVCILCMCLVPVESKRLLVPLELVTDNCKLPLECLSPINPDTSIASPGVLSLGKVSWLVSWERAESSVKGWKSRAWTLQWLESHKRRKQKMYCKWAFN